MKRNLSFKAMKKTFAISAGLLLLLAFAQCKKTDEDQTVEVNEEDIELTDNTMDYIDSNIQSKLDLLSDKDVPEVLDSMASWLSKQDGVTRATPYNDSLVITFVDETDAVLTIYDMTLNDDNEYNFSPLLPRNSMSLAQEDIVVGSHNVFIYDAFALSEELREGDSIDKYFSYCGYEPVHLKDEQCTVESLRDLTQYGYILLATHGTRKAFATREVVTPENRLRYKEELRRKKLRTWYAVYKIVDGYEFQDRFYCVTNKFINDLEGQFDNAVVFNSSCDGLKGNTPLKKAFLEKGAATYYGFDDEVESKYKYYASAFVATMLLSGYSTGEAAEVFKANYPQASYGTRFDMAGRDDVTWYDIPPVPTDGLIAYYPFNGNANDESGNGNNGILGGAGDGPTLTTDRFGNENSCYEFGGFYNPNWIDVPNSSSLHLDEAVTVSFWVQECFRGGTDGWGSYSTTDYNYGVIAKGGDGWSCPPGLWIYTNHSSENPDGFFGIIVNNSVSNANYVIHDVGPRINSVNDCDWLHCVVVIDRNRLSFYHNGIMVMDIMLDNNADFSAANDQDMHIGIEGGHFWNPRDGKLDDIRIYNRALTPSEIFALYKE